MRFLHTDIAGVFTVEPDVYRDARGYFLETYHAEKYHVEGFRLSFLQDNQSCSVHNTLRGLHMQLRKPQGKLIRVVTGEIWDVAVDLRLDSPTFGQWVAATLSSDNFRQFYIPEGCAHGFWVMSPTAIVEYKCTSLYDSTDEIGIAYDDPTIGIEWPAGSPILSARDRKNPTLEEAMPYLRRGRSRGCQEMSGANQGA